MRLSLILKPTFTLSDFSPKDDTYFLPYGSLWQLRMVVYNENILVALVMKSCRTLCVQARRIILNSLNSLKRCLA